MMTVSEIGFLRLKNLINVDNGQKKKEIGIAEREVKRVLEQYFLLSEKSVRFDVSEGELGYSIRIEANASDIKKCGII